MDIYDREHLTEFLVALFGLMSDNNRSTLR